MFRRITFDSMANFVDVIRFNIFSLSFRNALVFGLKYLIQLCGGALRCDLKNLNVTLAYYGPKK